MKYYIFWSVVKSMFYRTYFNNFLFKLNMKRLLLSNFCTTDEVCTSSSIIDNDQYSQWETGRYDTVVSYRHHRSVSITFNKSSHMFIIWIIIKEYSTQYLSSTGTQYAWGIVTYCTHDVCVILQYCTFTKVNYSTDHYRCNLQ